jgi:hypothetical protein
VDTALVISQLRSGLERSITKVADKVRTFKYIVAPEHVKGTCSVAKLKGRPCPTEPIDKLYRLFMSTPIRNNELPTKMHDKGVRYSLFSPSGVDGHAAIAKAWSRGQRDEYPHLD